MTVGLTNAGIFRTRSIWTCRRQRRPSSDISTCSTRSCAFCSVDDDPILREFAGVHLASDTAEVRTAVDGEEALAMLADWPADLVLLDLEMPRLDGFQVLERLSESEAYRHLPVIVVTGREDVSPPSTARLRRRRDLVRLQAAELAAALLPDPLRATRLPRRGRGPGAGRRGRGAHRRTRTPDVAAAHPGHRSRGAKPGASRRCKACSAPLAGPAREAA